MPNNLQSIVGGIFRAVSNNKVSLGLTDQNVTTDNPQTYTWIGHSDKLPTYPTDREQTQSPAIPWYSKSSGTGFSYSQPVPTDFTSRFAANTPGTDVSITDQASSIGSTIQSVPRYVPMGNMQFNGYEMSPQNGAHFKNYFANQLGMQNLNPLPNASNVLTAIQEQQGIQTDGSADVWHSHFRLFQNLGKDYRPAQQFRGS
jgi:hypothetical protein